MTTLCCCHMPWAAACTVTVWTNYPKCILATRRFRSKKWRATGKAQKTFDQIDLETATPYAAEDADVTLRLWKFLKPELARKGDTAVYETLERGMPVVLAKMENNGIKVDKSVLARLSSDFEQKKCGLEAQAHELAGRPFNLASPKQLGEILFDELGMPGGKKTKTGAWKTGAGVLEDLGERARAPQNHSLMAALCQIKIHLHGYPAQRNRCAHGPRSHQFFSGVHHNGAAVIV